MTLLQRLLISDGKQSVSQAKMHSTTNNLTGASRKKMNSYMSAAFEFCGLQPGHSSHSHPTLSYYEELSS